MDMELLHRCDVQQVLRCSLPALLSLSAQVQREVGELSELPVTGEHEAQGHRQADSKKQQFLTFVRFTS